MRSVFWLAIALLFPCAACDCGVSYIVPDTDPPLVMLVPDSGTTAHGSIRTLEDAPCTVDGAALDQGGSYREVHVGEVVVDWTIPGRPYDPELPVIVSPALPAVHAISAEPTSAFFRLQLFDVAAELPSADRACTVACGQNPVGTAYLVGTGLATDEEVAAAGMTLDEAKERLTGYAAEIDARDDDDVQGPGGCVSLKD